MMQSTTAKVYLHFVLILMRIKYMPRGPWNPAAAAAYSWPAEQAATGADADPAVFASDWVPEKAAACDRWNIPVGRSASDITGW